MTKTQVWLAAFVLLFAVLFIIGRITKKEDAETGMRQSMPAAGQPEQAAEAPQILRRLACTNCHGADLRGTAMAPALLGLKASWDREGLINYLRNPSAYSSSEKFKIYKEKYRNIVMPAYNSTDVKELGKIADYLLGLQ